MVYEPLYLRFRLGCRVRAALITVALVCSAAQACQEGAMPQETRTRFPDQRLVVTLGKRKILNDGVHLGLSFFPDQTPVVLATTPKLRVLMAAENRTYLVEGSGWTSLDTAREVLTPEKRNEYDNGYVGIAGVYRTARGRLYAIYHAEDHVGVPRFPSGIPGYYASIAMAVSDDDGVTWQRRGPVIKSAKDKSWTARPRQYDRGVGEPSLALDRSGDWLYVYYTDHSRVGTASVSIAMARASTDIRESSGIRFSKYHQGAFSEAGLGGAETPVIRLSTGPPTEALLPHVVFVRALNRYVMTLSVNNESDYMTDQGLTNSGVYVAFSMDGVAWSTPALLLRGYTVPLPGKAFCWGATIVLDGNNQRTGWLLYGYSPYWGHPDLAATPHHLAGQQVRFDEY
jgi:hypothetical protein